MAELKADEVLERARDIVRAHGFEPSDWLLAAVVEGMRAGARLVCDFAVVPTDYATEDALARVGVDWTCTALVRLPGDTPSAG